MEIEATKSTEKPKGHVSMKKRGPLHLIRVALYMIKYRSNGKSNTVHVDVGSKGLWKRIVGAMRPLHHQHLQHNHSPPPPMVVAPTTPKVDKLDDVLPSPMSPQESDSPSSRYASALDLQELDRNENGCYDSDGDEMIDARAEEFIAHFYEQMRLQRMDSINRYHEMIEKGSG